MQLDLEASGNDILHFAASLTQSTIFLMSQITWTTWLYGHILRDVWLVGMALLWHKSNTSSLMINHASDHVETVRGATFARPPSTPRIWPVMKLLSGCNRKPIALATSAGSPMRPRACIFSDVFLAASFSVNRLVPGVAICRSQQPLSEYQCFKFSQVARFLLTPSSHT